MENDEGRGPSVSDADEFAGEDPGPEKPEQPTAAKDGAVTDLNARRRGAPLADAEDGEEGEPGEEEMDPEDQLALFVVEDGKELTLGQLRKRGTPMEVRYVLTGKSIPDSTGGLLDPYSTSHLLVADCVVDHIKPQYIRDSEGRVEKVVLYQTLKPRIVQQATSGRGREMIQAAEDAKTAAEAA